MSLIFLPCFNVLTVSLNWVSLLAKLEEWNILNSTILDLLMLLKKKRRDLFHCTETPTKENCQNLEELNSWKLLWLSFSLILVGMKDRQSGSESTRLITQALHASHICCHSSCLITPRRFLFFPSLLVIQQMWRSREWNTTIQMRCRLLGSYTGCHRGNVFHIKINCVIINHRCSTSLTGTSAPNITFIWLL